MIHLFETILMQPPKRLLGPSGKPLGLMEGFQGWAFQGGRATGMADSRYKLVS